MKVRFCVAVKLQLNHIVIEYLSRLFIHFSFVHFFVQGYASIERF